MVNLQEKTKGLKVALAHDWVTAYRGGERVLEILCELFPEAPLLTLVYVQGATTPLIENRKIIPSFLQKLPKPHKYYKHYLPLFPLATECMPSKDYDLIISVSHAMMKSLPKGKSTKHWCYINTPMRYVWDRFEDYFGKHLVGWFASNVFFRPLAYLLRLYDKATCQRVDRYIPNSSFITQRVMNYYGIDAQHINPPVNIEKFKQIKRQPEDFYLFFSALVPYKKPDHAVLACQNLKKKIVVIGNGQELKRLKELADPNYVNFIQNASDEVIQDHYARAKALLFPGVEDFGIVPVEAIASGCPVIAINEGGIKDTMNKDTCLFYSEQTVSGLQKAIEEFEISNKVWDRTKMLEKAEYFSNANFKARIEKSLLDFVDKEF